MHRCRNTQGFVLITVLLLVVMLAALLVECNYRSRMSLHGADDFHQRLQAIHAARAGLNIAQAALIQHPEYLGRDALRKLLNREVCLPVGRGQCRISVVQEDGKVLVEIEQNLD